MRSVFQRSFWVLFIVLIAAVTPTLAQQPTSAPSATPRINNPTETHSAPTVIAPTNSASTATVTLAATLDALITPAATATRDTAPFDPLTQADLSVLTGNVQRPNGIAYFNGFLYISCSGDGTIYQTDSVTGQTRTYIFGIQNSHALIAEEETNGAVTIWATDYGANSLVRVRQGRAEQFVRNLASPWGITDIGGTYFLVTNVRGNSITRIDRDGEATVIVEGLASPTGIANDSRAVYFANNGSARRAVEWISIADLEAGAEPQPLISGIQNPTGVQMGADGNLYVAYSLGTRGVVGRVNPDECRENGGCTNEQVEIVLFTEIASPLAGLTITPDMRLFVHTMFSPDIYWGQL